MSKFSVAAVISNHCVLQRNKNITVFGYDDENARTKISVGLFNVSGKVIASNCGESSNGRWEIQLPPLSAQTGCTLKIEADNNDVLSFTDIAIGEVWLAGGQSNMEFELQNCTEGPEALKAEKSTDCSKSKNSEVRFYYTNKIAWKDEYFYEAERNTCWQTWDSEWKKSWSAVGYFYGKKLAEDLDCVVGVIGCNWGGTSASAWMRKEYLEKDEELRTYLDEQTEATKDKTIEQQCAEYDAYEKENNEWNIKCGELYNTVPGIEWAEVEKRLGKSPWPGPRSCKNPYRPTGLYDCMLSRIIPYSIKGVIWYQGESDDHKPGMYYKLFSKMIQNWRDDWCDDSLPFIFIQLPNHRNKYDKDYKSWCLIREAQAKVHNTIKNAWMTCSLDLGMFNDIHPKAKKVIAGRMENIALAKVYNQAKDEEVLAPMLESSRVDNQTETMILNFSNTCGGFVTKEDSKTLEEYKLMEGLQNNEVPANFTGFELAGEDGVYYPAAFTFKGDKILLTCSKVPSPKYARYAWFNYGPVTIYGKNNLPLAPFRTSEKDSSAATEHAAIQQIMTV